jgi:sialic acid synthase SpsE
MWCVTKYPAQALDYMSFPYSDFYGISSHVPSTDISVYAARHGARVFENHLTLTRNQPGCDHPASIEPAELKTMVKKIHEVYKYADIA